MRSLRFVVAALPIGALLVFGVNCFNPQYASPGYNCDVTMDRTCPDGQSCIAGQCRDTNGDGGSSASGSIPKTGTYTGPTQDPGLNSIDSCTDKALEPNDTIATAVQLPAIAVDGAALPLVKLAICPTGDNPLAKGHDVDYYQMNVTENANVLVKIVYDIKYGDLDVGIFRPDGSIVKSDGTAVSNACVAASLPMGAYYVGVVGAGNTAVNNYTMSIRLTSAATTCDTTPPDMSF